VDLKRGERYERNRDGKVFEVVGEREAWPGWVYVRTTRNGQTKLEFVSLHNFDKRFTALP
jgi:hypothetical protein